MDKIRSLSAAIRYGSKLKPQAIGALFKFNAATEMIHSCAMGAAYDAVVTAKGGHVSSAVQPHVDDVLHEHFGEIMNKPLWISSECGAIEGCALEVIPYLNDTLRWSRERIADWLESQGL